MSYKTKCSLCVAIVLWASAFVGIRAGLKEYSPEGLALLRFLIASLCMGLIYLSVPKRSSLGLLDKVKLMAIGALGIGLYNIMLNYGELSLSPGIASFIISQAPIITACFAIFFLGEQLKLKQFLGFLISILGVAFIMLGEKGSFKFDISFFYILIATITSSLYSILQKPFLKKYTTVCCTTYIIWGAALSLSFYFPQLQHDLSHASLKTTITVIYLGIFPAAIAYIAWSYALSSMPASRAISFFYFTPFVATILGWIFLNEIPVTMSILGGILAIFGVIIVNHSYSLKKLRVN